ncbi:MAG: MGMT family protein [Tepidisphaerales bacterium]
MTSTELQRFIEDGRLHPAMTFSQKVWTLTARIPRGRVTSYAELARALGGHGYRAVGQALNRNPYAPRVPCHRVVGSDGRLTGYAGGVAKKQQLLIREGIRIEDGKVVGRAFFPLSAA